MDAAELPAQPSDPHARAAAPTEAGLTEREREILAFERQWWKYPGLKEQAIHELFGVSPTRYYQLVNRLIDKREALEADPMLVKRLRRLRSGRQRARSAPRLGR
ncbi:MAG: DUF3263 domain-containing protein [Actinophytocola sp.]|uniref:DUF3263 domain-containing protein n=1 Tax=Actinophytocola sp. TaxID=1872138 RepID=UPI003D6BB597